MNRRLVGERHHISSPCTSSSKPMPLRCPSSTSAKTASLSAASHLSVRCADQFQSVQLPETVEEVLNRGTATCAEFNPWGTLLAGRPGKPNCTVSQLAVDYSPSHTTGKQLPQCTATRQSMNSVSCSCSWRCVGRSHNLGLCNKGHSQGQPATRPCSHQPGLDEGWPARHLCR